MKYIASVSFGKDSLCMLLKLIEKNAPLDEVVFYDAGMEFKAIYEARDRVLPILERHGFHTPNFTRPARLPSICWKSPYTARRTVFTMGIPGAEAVRVGNGDEDKRTGQPCEEVSR